MVLGVFDEDSTVILLFVLVALTAWTGGAGYAENPLVWGFALFIGAVFALISAVIGSGLGILLPLVFVGVLFYLKGLGSVLGGGTVAWIICAFVIMILAGAGYV